MSSITSKLNLKELFNIKWLLNFKRNKLLTIEYDDTCIRVVVASKVKNFCIDHFEEFKLEKNIVKNGEIVNPYEFCHYLRNIVKEFNIKYVGFVLPFVNKYFYKKILINKKDVGYLRYNGDIFSYISDHLKSTVGFDDFLFDYMIQSDNDDNIELIVVFIKKENLQGIDQVTKILNVKLSIISCNKILLFYFMINFFYKKEKTPKAPTLLTFETSEYIIMLIIVDSQIVYNNEFMKNISNDTFYSWLQRSYNILKLMLDNKINEIHAVYYFVNESNFNIFYEFTKNICIKKYMDINNYSFIDIYNNENKVELKSDIVKFILPISLAHMELSHE